MQKSSTSTSIRSLHSTGKARRSCDNHTWQATHTKTGATHDNGSEIEIVTGIVTCLRAAWGYGRFSGGNCYLSNRGWFRFPPVACGVRWECVRTRSALLPSFPVHPATENVSQLSFEKMNSLKSTSHTHQCLPPEAKKLQRPPPPGSFYKAGLNRGPNEPLSLTPAPRPFTYLVTSHYPKPTLDCKG